MSQRHRPEDGPRTVRVPAEIQRPDPIVFGLTARQTALAASVLGVLWAAWQASKPWLPTPVFLAVAVPIATAAVTVLTVRKHGRGLEDVLADWWRHYRNPKRLVPADGLAGDVPPPVPEWVDVPAQPLPAPLRLPPAAIAETGVVDLGRHGLARPAACSTVNFGLRSPGEQRALLAGFARWLHSLTGPVQIVARAERLDLTPVTRRLTSQASRLPHPALETACRAHAAFLEDLAATRHPIRRRVTLVLTAAGQAEASQLAHRAEDTARALAGSDVTVTPLSGAHTSGLLRAAADPQHTRTPTGDGAAVIHGKSSLIDPADSIADHDAERN